MSAVIKDGKTAYRRPHDVDAMGHNFRVFAEADCPNEPLYAALAEGIAEQPAILAMVLEAPYAQRRPVLLFASVHDLLLEGADHPLAAFYPSVVGMASARRDLDAAPAAFADFCATHRPALLERLTTRATQTNEVGRSAVLRLVLAGLDPARPIALIDVGCSAGLNLLVDRYRFAYAVDGTTIEVGDPAAAFAIPCQVDDLPAGDVARPDVPTIARRVGLDLNPLDVRAARDARWLRACAWPSDVERQDRLARAIATATTVNLDLRTGPANDLLDALLPTLPADVRPVVFHSWVVSYFDGESRRGFAERMRAMVESQDGVWISAEAPDTVPGLDAPRLPVDAPAPEREGTLWHVGQRDGHGRFTARLVARSHPHGRWVRWLDDQA